MSQQLLHLAETYKIKILEDLCQAASADIDRDKMASLMMLNPAEAEESVVEIK